MATHPAKLLDLSVLVASLEDEAEQGFVQTQVLPLSPGRFLRLYNYSKRAQFKRHWTPATILARGLVIEFLDGAPSRLVALPFPKFFNAGEAEGAGSVDFSSPFEAFEKMDGSLGVVFCVDGEWRVATRGSFSSDQAVWATRWLNERQGLVGRLDPDVTYLMEVIYSENRIVIRYDYEGLVLLGAYRVSTGEELDYTNDLLPLSSSVSIAQRFVFESLADAVNYVKDLPSNREGFVIRFTSTGARIKLKGAEYCALHKMISNITPLAIWELVSRSYDFDSYKASMPEEFWGDIDEMVAWFVGRRDEMVREVEVRAESYAHLSHKELGLLLGSKGNDQDRIDRMMFPYRRKGLEGILPMIYDDIRPTGNVIPGSSMVRVQESE